MIVILARILACVIFWKITLGASQNFHCRSSPGFWARIFSLIVKLVGPIFTWNQHTLVAHVLMYDLCEKHVMCMSLLFGVRCVR